MSTFKKAYAFVKKHWGSDDDVLPSDLNRYEDGIDDLYSVTNQTNTNIGNLSNLLSQAKSNIVTAINEIVTNLQSEIETRGNTDTELDRKINVLYTNGFNGEYRHYDGDLTDLNDFTTLGKFEIVKDLSTIKNLPVNASGLVRFSIVVEKRISNVYRQEIHFKSTPFFNRSFYRDTLDNGDWGEWAEVATTTKTDISSLLNGWTCNASFPNVVIQKTGNIATMTAVLQDGVKTAGTQLCVLPAGYRPTQGFKALMVAYADASLVNQEMVRVSIGTGGTITIDTPFTQKYLSINLTYPV